MENQPSTKKIPEMQYIHSFDPFYGCITQWYIAFKPGDRIAKCTQCQLESLSDESLPFYKVKIDDEHDDYFCGCRGWD
jgi:hypothetical protein